MGTRHSTSSPVRCKRRTRRDLSLGDLLPCRAVRGLRSLGVWIVIVLATIFFGLPAIPIGLAPPRGRWMFHWARGWSRILLVAAGARVRVLHPERLDPSREFVVTPNHESFFDIPVLFSTLPRAGGLPRQAEPLPAAVHGLGDGRRGIRPGRPRREGPHARHDRRVAATPRARNVADRVPRGDADADRASFCRSRPARRCSRSAPGRPLLPVAIAGTFRIQQRGGFTISPSRVVVAVGEPIDVTGKTAADRAEITARLRDAVSGLREEAREALT